MSEQEPEEQAGHSGTPTVFFSYSRTDQAEALPIIESIKAAGYDLWWDGMLDPGSKYLEETETVLNGATSIVVLWSKTSINSNWVRDEAMVGRDKERMIPLSLDGTQPPLGFRQFQVISFENWKGRQDGPEMTALLRTLAAAHDPEATARAAVSVPATPVRKPLTRRSLLWGGAAALVFTGGAAGLLLSRQTGRRPLSGNSLAVLPFANLSGNADLDYISSGISAELRSAFTRNATLRVVGQRSSEAFRDSAVDAIAVAKRLNVAYILDGNLRQSGTDLRMSAELVDGRTGFTEWSSDYSAAPDDLVSIQNEMVTSIVQSMSTQFETDEADGVGATSNAEAYDAYLRGLDLWKRAADPDEARIALGFLDRAVSLDPRFASAHAERGLILSWLSSSSADETVSRQLLADAIEAARRAMEFGPDLADAHSTFGWVEFFSARNIAEAAEPFETSRRLGQGDAAILARYAIYACFIGKASEAEAAISKAILLDPLNSNMLNSAALIRYYAGDYRASLEASRAALDLDPMMGVARFWAGAAEIQLGEPELAIETCQAEPNPDAKYTCLAIAYGKAGRPEDAAAALDTLNADYGASAAYQRAQIFAQSGALDEAMANLEAARDIGDAGLIAALVDPMLDPLRESEAFSLLLKEIGFDTV